jgi:Alpha/beta hydrolase family
LTITSEVIDTAHLSLHSGSHTQQSKGAAHDSRNPDRSRSLLNTVTSKDGTVIAFDGAGAGPALVLVGGAFQHRALDPRTARLADLLSDRFSVYNYDRRGRGDSGDTAPYAVEREIEDIEALIEDAGGSAFVFGMSSGAVLALRAAASGLPIQSSRSTSRPSSSTTAGRRFPTTTRRPSPSLSRPVGAATPSPTS